MLFVVFFMGIWKERDTGINDSKFTLIFNLPSVYLWMQILFLWVTPSQRDVLLILCYDILLTFPSPLRNICSSLSALTLKTLMCRIWWGPNNATKWQMGFNSSFKGLNSCPAFSVATNRAVFFPVNSTPPPSKLLSAEMETNLVPKVQWYIRLIEKNQRWNGIILKEFQFGDFIFLMWSSYLGQLKNKLLYPTNCI